jgi:predicted Zn-dependent protease
MKAAAFVCAMFVAHGAPARTRSSAPPRQAQASGDKASIRQAQDRRLNITDKEERQLGEQVSLKLRDRFGVVQDEEVTKYVSLVGGVLAQASSVRRSTGSSSCSTPTASTRSRRPAASCTSRAGCSA